MKRLFMEKKFNDFQDVTYAAIYQKLSQKASPNTGGDEWPCPLF